ncbi:MAG: hypothetical protein JWR18_3595 [Segetibacter sp.]|nr:hypothetical protein [Segetibacter sp.]
MQIQFNDAYLEKLYANQTQTESQFSVRKLLFNSKKLF